MRPVSTVILQPTLASASVNSNIIDLRQIVNFSLQAIGGTGSLAGTIQLQISNTPCNQAAFSNYVTTNNPVWTNLGTALTFNQSSTASSQIIGKQDSSYVALRAVFTDTSGGTNTATLTLNFFALGV